MLVEKAQKMLRYLFIEVIITNLRVECLHIYDTSFIRKG